MQNRILERRCKCRFSVFVTASAWKGIKHKGADHFSTRDEVSRGNDAVQSREIACSAYVQGLLNSEKKRTRVLPFEKQCVSIRRGFSFVIVRPDSSGSTHPMASKVSMTGVMFALCASIESNSL